MRLMDTNSYTCTKVQALPLKLADIGGIKSKAPFAQVLAPQRSFYLHAHSFVACVKYICASLIGRFDHALLQCHWQLLFASRDMDTVYMSIAHHVWFCGINQYTMEQKMVLASALEVLATKIYLKSAAHTISSQMDGGAHVLCFNP